MPPSAFDYTNRPSKISVLEPLLGQSGWLEVSKLTVSAVEVDEFLIIARRADHEQPLDEDICRKLPTLPVSRTTPYGTADDADGRRSETANLRTSAPSAVHATGEDLFAGTTVPDRLSCARPK